MRTPGWCVGMLMAGDDASPTVTGCVLLFCLSEVEVRLLIEEPRATAVKKQQRKQKQRSAVETFVVRFLKCNLNLFFFSL